MEFARLTDGLLAAARKAGDVILADWNEDREIARKGRIDLVTKTDLRVEALLREELGVITSYSIHYTKLYEKGSSERRAGSSARWPFTTKVSRSANSALT